MKLPDLINEIQGEFDEKFYKDGEYIEEPRVDLHAFLDQALRKVAGAAIEAVRPELEPREWGNPARLADYTNGFNECRAQIKSLVISFLGE